MNYLANKNCRINGKDYLKGEVIPATEMNIYECERLVKFNILVELPSNVSAKALSISKPTERTVSIPIYATGESVNLSESSLITVLTICQMPVEDAIEQIEQVTDKNIYDLLCVLETRTKVKTKLKKLDETLLDRAEDENNTEIQAPIEEFDNKDNDGGDE